MRIPGRFFVNNPDFRYAYFAEDFHVGLISSRCLRTENISGRSQLDHEFDVLAACVDELGVLVDTAYMVMHNSALFTEWDTYYKISNDASASKHFDLHTGIVDVHD